MSKQTSLIKLKDIIEGVKSEGEDLTRITNDPNKISNLYLCFMTPTTALKYITKVKKLIAALEFELASPGLKDSSDDEKSVQKLNQLRNLLKQYEDELKEWQLI